MSTRRVLVLIDYPQDLDLLLPVITRLAKSCTVWVTDHASRRSSRIKYFLNTHSIKWVIKKRLWLGLGLAGSIKEFTSLLTACESNLKPHRAAHSLAKLFRSKKKMTWTLQHGFENVGISYFDSHQNVDFASEFIGVWGEAFLNERRIQPLTRGKCIPIGLTKNYYASIHPRLPIMEGKQIISVFENLHWNRYSDLYRQRFIVDLKSVAEAFPEFYFVLKPHHDERWSVSQKKYLSCMPGNIIIADPRSSQWQLYTAPGLIQISELVITTPSTVALDAAMMSKRVAVVGYHLNLEKYAPLPILKSQADWKKFITGKKEDNSLTCLTSFCDRWVREGDAVDELIKRLQT